MLMNNPVDKLFERKLSEHVMEPSANAWARIAENLPKKIEEWCGSVSQPGLLLLV